MKKNHRGERKGSDIPKLNKKGTRGGKREGSGRKKKEPTIVRRYPLFLDDKIQKLILDFRNEKGQIKTIHPMPKP